MQPALYRAERPEVFEDIIGQKHIVRILQNQIRTGTVSQAYLFAGTHGTGKTSTARILAKAVNCLEGEPGTDSAAGIPCGSCENCEAIREGRFVDCIELDAASNNGVDDLRSIIEMVKYPPAVGRYKVYIIDEVHMLSTAAENAFLKTLEEPPEHAIFILATTDPQKVRSTIRSRCMQLNFRRVTEEELAEGMKRICAKRGIPATDDALATIASRAGGSVRDALSILEQCAAAGDSRLDRAAVLEYTGAAGTDFFLALTGAVIGGDAGKALVYIDEIIKRGKDPRQILKDWLGHMRDLMVVKYVSRAERIVGSSEENISRLRAQAALTDAAFIERSIRLISDYINLGRYSERPRILLETAAVRLASAEEAAPAAGRAAAGSAAAKSAARSAVSNTGRPAGAQTASAEAARNTAPAHHASAGAGRPETRDAEESGGTAEELLGSMIAETRAEQPGSPEEMWDRIVREVSAADRTFMSLVGRYSVGTEFDSGKLVVIVSPGKLRLAEDKNAEIGAAARRIYGNGVYVTLRGGVISKSGAAEEAPVMSESETSRIIDEDINANEVIEDIQDLFGITPVIED